MQGVEKDIPKSLLIEILQSEFKDSQEAKKKYEDELAEVKSQLTTLMPFKE